ncbi:MULTISPECIES: shikimate dehydrogenase [unclassified Clostridioides]|uniref:shikimate dehydrogenase n=1 Tax=unclassified Clostridioides TaxID=2635829 RepID=UPI001D0FD945|nr:shikimate dehydrogenase [Clostridioides sp. ES-S-0171-01]MCC0687400.1 shikimate dehydrogenase [Clostridioides sp. ES-S-0056-01]UDN56274.1 shikimate dehydrogenase [Clostridioides sp. ES-S-0054-01]
MNFFGLVGEKLSHSVSPQIHKRIFEILNIESAYKNFEISKEDIYKLDGAIKLLGIQGVNVTVPYKERIMKHLDFISSEAKRIGAVNTILLRENMLYGYNTDYFGLDSMFKMLNIDVLGKVAVILGTGGASKAALTYLLDSGIEKVYVATRKKDNKKLLNSKAILIDYEELKCITGDIILNATPVGMYPNVGISPVPKSIIQNFDTLIDLIYNPGETEFLRIGNSIGKKTCDGLYMLVGQAIKSQEIWQDTKIDNSILDVIYNELKLEFFKGNYYDK